VRKGKIVALAIAVACILTGAVLALIAFRMIRFDPQGLRSAFWESRTQTVTESFQLIEIHEHSADLRICPSGDGITRIEYAEHENDRLEAEVRDGVLVVNRTDSRRWFERIGFIWQQEPGTTLYLAEDAFAALEAYTASGDIALTEGFSFDRLYLESASGDFDVRSCTASEVSLKTVSGEICLTDAETDNLTVRSVSGDVSLQTVVCGTLQAGTVSGEITIAADCRAETRAELHTTSGDVAFGGWYGALSVQTVSGDVTGTVLSPMRFETSTASGEVRVPASAAEGSLCSVQTVSGDIRIESGGE